MSTDQRTYKQVSALFQHELDKDGQDPVPGSLRANGTMIRTYHDSPVLHPTNGLEALARHIGYTMMEQALRTPLQSVQSTGGMTNADIADTLCEIWHDDLYDVPQAPEPNEYGHFQEEFEALYQALVSTELTMTPANPPNNLEASVLRLQWDPSWTVAMLSRRVRHTVLVQWGDVPYSYTLHSDDDTACITRTDLVGVSWAINAHNGQVTGGTEPNPYEYTLAAAAQRYADSL